MAHIVFNVFFVDSESCVIHHFTLSTDFQSLFNSSTALLFAVITNDRLYCDESAIDYFLFDKEQGFGFQSLYTRDGSIDETYRVKNNDLVEFPMGYHLTQTAPGYKMYILWLMAGDEQGIHRTNDPDHDWVLQK